MLLSGGTLLETLREAGAHVPAACGGRGRCGTCRVRLGQGARSVPPPDRDEQEILRRRGAGPGERLACRLQVPAGLLLEVLPPERGGSGGADKAAALFERAVSRSWFKTVDVSLEPFSNDSPGGLLERLASALGLSGPLTAQLDLLSRLDELAAGPGPAVLRALVAAEAGGPRPHAPELPRAPGLPQPAKLVGVLAPGLDPLGLAVDLGTTTIAVYLADLESGAVLSTGTSANPQNRWGDDLMSRLTAAAEAGDRLRDAAWDGVGQALEGAAEDIGLSAAEILGRIVDVSLVGNSAMHHLAFGLPVRRLARAPYELLAAGALSASAKSLTDLFRPWVPIRALPLIAGFVGSDVVGGLLAAGLTGGQELSPQLYIDIGTNAEMVLVDSRGAWACSAAAGPALEGARLSRGMPAGPGAVVRARLTPSGIGWKTWDGGAPQGLSGTGAMSLLASLRAAEAVDERGLLRPERLPKDCFVSESEGGRAVVLSGDVLLTEADIAELMLARAAFIAGRRMLLRACGRREEEIVSVRVAGTLGNEIDPADLVSLGMVPAAARVEPIGNAAGEGAVLALLDRDLWLQAAVLRANVSYVELSGDPLFEEWFVDSLVFA
ncbi:MAG: ASKHA domain-containing protein [Thermoleophilia bacterium]